MKWGIGIVALIIAGALYYFWQQSHFDAEAEQRAQSAALEAEVKTRMKDEDPPKVIPAGTIMEDGTI